MFCYLEAVIFYAHATACRTASVQSMPRGFCTIWKYVNTQYDLFPVAPVTAPATDRLKPGAFQLS